MPSVAEYQEHLINSIAPRVRAEMGKDSFTDAQILEFEAAVKERRAYRSAKRTLQDPGIHRKMAASDIKILRDLIASVESEPFKVESFAGLDRYGKRINTFLEHRDYLNKGLPTYSVDRLAGHLKKKRAGSYMRHDPVVAYPVEKMPATFECDDRYMLIFDGLSLEGGVAYCSPHTEQNGIDDDGSPMHSLARIRRYRLAYNLLPASARADIESKIVPVIAWDHSYMVLVGSNG